MNLNVKIYLDMSTDVWIAGFVWFIIVEHLITPAWRCLGLKCCAGRSSGGHSSQAELLGSGSPSVPCCVARSARSEHGRGAHARVSGISRARRQCERVPRAGEWWRRAV